MRLRREVVFSLLDSPAFGGAENYLLSHVNVIVGMGYDYVVATNNDLVRSQFRAGVARDQRRHVRIIHLPYVLDAIGNWKGLVKFFFFAPGALWWVLVTVWRLRRTYDGVTCYLAGFSDRLLFSPFLRLLGCRVIWIEIGPLEPTFAKNWGFPKLLYRLSEWSVHAITTTSQYTKDSIIRMTRFPPQAITLIYPDTTPWKNSDIQAFRVRGAAWREKHRLTRSRLALVVARLASENEIDVVIEAIAQVPDVFLGIVGDGPQRAELEEQVREYGLTKRVVFTGFVSAKEKFSLLAAADVFLFPRAWDLDGFGMTTIEALSVKTPVITTDFGPQREIIHHMQTGMRYRPHDAHDLARTIMTFFSLPSGARRRMGQQGRLTLERFSPAMTNARLNQLLTDLRDS